MRLSTAGPATVPRRRRRWVAIILMTVPLCGFAAAPAAAPAASHLGVHYIVQSSASDVRFLVYRTGLLAAFGHNHVVRATRIEGEIIARPDDFSASRFQLSMPVKAFRVDNHADRRKEGKPFAEQPSPRAIAATTHNMLSARVLDAAQYPNVTVRSAAISGTPRHALITVRITLRGVQRELKVPVKIAVSGSSLTATGKFDLSQHDFGIKPYSTLGGGLRVKNIVGVEIHLVAKEAAGG